MKPAFKKGVPDSYVIVGYFVIGFIIATAFCSCCSGNLPAVILLSYSIGVIVFGSRVFKTIAIVISILCIWGIISQTQARKRFSQYAGTKHSLRVVQAQIDAYYQSQGVLPASLSDLPASEQNVNGFLDYWGHPIQYTVESDEVTLLSLGCPFRCPQG